jgi:hypothetical protein
VVSSIWPPPRPGLEQLDGYRQALLQRLEQQPGDFARAIAVLPEDEWHIRTDGQGRSVHALASHVRDMELLAWLPRVIRILDEDEPVFPPDPFAHWDEARYDAGESMADMLTAWSQARAEMVHRLRGLPPAGWARLGFYSPVGRRTVQWWAERALAHARDHFADIGAALSA